jgi:hypothetical protein
VTAADSAFADHRQLAIIREARGCFILATQTFEALATTLGPDRAKAFTKRTILPSPCWFSSLKRGCQ